MKDFKYRLARSKRKTLAVYVLPDASVEVRAPLRMPISAIDAFVASKKGWIDTHIQDVRQKLREREKYSAGEGERILFLGQEYPVRLAAGQTVKLEKGVCFLPADEQERRKVLTEWYKQRAKVLLPQFLEKWKGFTGISCRSVAVGNAVSRWGSCSGRDDIRFSWRLILLPEELIDYVTVHELCHTVEHNHSPAFWSKVEEFLPGAMETRKRLRWMEQQYAAQFHWLNLV